MLRKIIFLLVFVLTLVFSSSILVHAESEQEIVAVNFLKFLKSDKEILSAQRLEANELAPAEAKVFAGYLVQLRDGGYILISASKDLTPVKAYSLSGSFDALPEPYKRFLLKELEYNVRTLGAAKALLPAAITENQQRWNFLLKFEKTITPLAYEANQILLTTKWNQGYPYNKFLPEINGKNVLAGCVNIAVGQLMKYYGYPASGKGNALYTWNSQQLKTILYRDFSWENMPDVLDSTTPAYQIDEVALLLRDLGIVNHTSFGLADSGAAINTNALIENFGFSNTIQKMDNSNVTQFFDTLKGEINGLRPALLSFPNHMTVADGYSSDPTGKTIHVNMGWGGVKDSSGNDTNNFYYLDDKISAGAFQWDPILTIYYNVKPCNGAECTPNLETGDTINNLSISGNFNYDIDTDRYEVYMKGPTTISASRNWNYSNFGFFINLYNNSTGSVVFSTDGHENKNTQISVGDLTPGKYTVKISLYDETGHNWSYDVNNPQYTVSITSNALTDAEKSAIDSSLDIGPVIFNNLNDIFLNSTSLDPYKILIDARDENGNTITLSAANTNNSAVQIALLKNILSITPVTGASKIASKITITATANGKTAEKSFIVMALNEDIAFGKKFTVNGSFKSQTDIDKHKVILDGTCKITGYRGCSSQAFFSSVIDITNQSYVTGPINTEINYTFLENIYMIGASQSWQGTAWSCSAASSDKYTLTVSCPNADDSVTTIAQMFGIDLSGAEGNIPTSSVLALKAGWNFISFTKQPPAGDMATILADISSGVRVIWGFNNQTKQWLKWKPSDTTSTLTSLGYGKGYWVYMNNAGTINMTTWTAPETTKITLSEGWNLVGYLGADGTSVETAFSGLVDNQGNKQWVIVWGWGDGRWSAKHATINLSVQPLARLYQKKAYWIEVNAATSWQQ